MRFFAYEFSKRSGHLLAEKLKDELIKHMLNFDIKLFFFLNRLAGKSKLGDFVIALFGEYLPYGLVIIAIFSLFLDPPLARQPLLVTTITLLGSLISRFCLGTPVRLMYKRIRPHKVHRVHNVLSEESFSFPSGHSLFFFGFSTVIFCFDPVMGTLFLAGTCLITLCRVIAGVHYPADIAAGMIIGLFSGLVSFLVFTHFVSTLLYS